MKERVADWVWTGCGVGVGCRRGVVERSVERCADISDADERTTVCRNQGVAVSRYLRTAMGSPLFGPVIGALQLHVYAEFGTQRK